MTATMKSRNVLIGDREEDNARQLLAKVGTAPYSVAVVGAANRQITVPSDLAATIQSVVSAVAAGNKISIERLPEELTTTSAADVLGVSRPAVMKMIQRGELSSHKVGTHHRVRREDVIELNQVRRERQRKAVAELREIDEALESF